MKFIFEIFLAYISIYTYIEIEITRPHCMSSM